MVTRFATSAHEDKKSGMKNLIEFVFKKKNLMLYICIWYPLYFVFVSDIRIMLEDNVYLKEVYKWETQWVQ